jgi:hypothetical protein
VMGSPAQLPQARPSAPPAPTAQTGGVPGTSSGAPVNAPVSDPLLARSAAPAGETPEPPVVTLKAKAGLFECASKASVQVKSVAADANSMVMKWGQKDFTLRGGHTPSGALRYEDARAGLAWIIIVGKAMLLDTKAGRPLANDCKER